MLVTCLKIFSGNLYPTSIYSKRAGKTISFCLKMTIFGIILSKISSKYTPIRTKLHHFSEYSERIC